MHSDRELPAGTRAFNRRVDFLDPHGQFLWRRPVATVRRRPNYLWLCHTELGLGGAGLRTGRCGVVSTAATGDHQHNQRKRDGAPGHQRRISRGVARIGGRLWRWFGGSPLPSRQGGADRWLAELLTRKPPPRRECGAAPALQHEDGERTLIARLAQAIWTTVLATRESSHQRLVVRLGLNQPI